MALTVTHSTAADGTFSASGTTAWNAAHTVSGSPEILLAAVLDTTGDLNSGTQTMFSRSITVTAGRRYRIELEFSILNNSGATRTYTPTIALGALSLGSGEGTALNASATNLYSRRIWATFNVVSTSRSVVHMFTQGTNANVSDGTLGNSSVTVVLGGRNVTASDITGSQTLSFTLATSGTGGTAQSVFWGGYEVREITAV